MLGRGTVRGGVSVPGAEPVLSFREALAALEVRGRFGIRLGLGRTRALLGELGHPERDFRGALIAGTNGKGSVLALAAAAIEAAGLRAGVTPKPHLVSYRERLQIGGRLVSPLEFARLAARVLAAAERIGQRQGEPTEFEVLTALAYVWFAEQSVDLALVEVGLGGRLDATHAWDGGVAVVTNVDLDHTDRLGSTVEQIAHEKAAIIGRGDQAVTGVAGPALELIRRRARRVGAPLTEVTAAPIMGLDRDGITVELAGLGPTRVGLRGRHQAANVAVAAALLDGLEAAEIARVPADARRRGFAAARWPGRLELLAVDPSGQVRILDGSSANDRTSRTSLEVLLDGAHNPAAAAVLARALDDLRPFLAGGTERPPAPITVLTGVLADKDAVGLVRALSRAEAIHGARIICTQVDAPRALSAESLAPIWMDELPGSRPETTSDLDRAVGMALGGGSGLVLVTGSLYLVGAVRARLVHDPELEDPRDG